MSKIAIKHGLFLVAVTALSLAVVAPLTAAALPARAAAAQADTQDQETETQDKQATAEDKKAVASTRLATAKLKVCQNREKTITAIMHRMSDRGQKRLDLFTTIADRTETFYTTKGKTLSTYDSLVADVTAKKADAQTAVDATKAAATDFSCDGADPKSVATTFKTDVQAQNNALKAYKTAVKNLIVGVKSVQSTTTDKSSGGGAE